MEIIVSNTPDIAAGQALSDILDTHADNPVLLMLSGGSALSLLSQIDVSVLDSRVTITTLDERFSSDPLINNFAQIEQTSFFKAAINRSAQIISTKIDATDTLQDAGNRFASELQKWRNQNPNGVIVATMGIGADGHTAGMFPGEHAVDFNGDSWVVAYAVPKEVNPYAERITVTNTFLREHVNKAVVFVVGAKKSHLVASLAVNDCNLVETPVCILTKMSDVKLFTDM